MSLSGAQGPFFSVVTATFGAEAHVSGLLASLLSQSETDWEWVVQDGASRDRTVDVVRASGDDRIHVQSEIDRGIYDGLNRAITRARGRWIVILGADDELAGPEVLALLRKALREAPFAPRAVLGAAQVGLNEIFRSTLGMRTLVVNTIHHQGAVYAREEFSRFQFDQSAPVVADYEHSLRLLLSRAPVLRTDLVIARCGDQGISKTTDEAQLYHEMHALRSKHLPTPLSGALRAVGMANVRRRTLQRCFQWQRTSQA